MAVIKSFTSLEQSKKLAKILPIDTADMWYSHYGDPKYNSTIAYEGKQWFLCQLRNSSHDIPCWSLAALLDVLPFHIISNNQGYAFSIHKGLDKNGETYTVRYNVFNTDVCLYKTEYYNNLIDACVEMITKLHELKKK